MTGPDRRNLRRPFLTALFVLAGAAEALAQDKVPVPLVRPQHQTEASGPEQKPGEKPAADKPTPDKNGDAAEKPKPPVQTGPPFDLAASKACESDLKRRRVPFTVLDPIAEQNGCGTERPLMVTSLAGNIKLPAPVTLRCATALALTQWVTETVVPAAKLHLETEIATVETGTSYQCRRRNNRPDGKLSEHAFANGIDISGFRLADGRRIQVMARPDSPAPERAFQAAVRGAACAYFTTVLGPGSDSSHQSHFHLDNAYRRGGYRLCQ